MRFALILSILVAVTPFQAAATPIRADQLLWGCEGRGSKDEAVLNFLSCIKYISGVIDGFQVMARVSDTKIICMPKTGISNDQAVKLFVKWINERPEQMHQTARTELLVMLRTTFPCAQ